LHLDDDLGAAEQSGGVHLGHRGSGQRLGVDVVEHLVYRAQLVTEYRLHIGPRDRRRLVLQVRQLADELNRHQVASGGQLLAELHERHAALVHGTTDRARQLPP